MFSDNKTHGLYSRKRSGAADHQQCDFWYRFYEIASIMPVACASALPAAFKLLYTDFICEL